MALVITAGFPRDMPERADGIMPFESASFDPLYAQARAPLRGGLVQVANLGADLWSMQFKTHVLSYDDALDYLAWLQSLRGGARLFKAWHPLLRYPLAYKDGFGSMVRAGGGAFDGTATLSSVATDRESVTLTQFPVGFVMTRGDMVSVPFGSSRALLRVVAGGTASGAGAVTVSIEPFVPLGITTGVAVSVVKPWCLAVVQAESIRGPFQPGQVGTVEFAAVQTY